MPSMEIFGRRWKVGSDDFVYPMVVENLIRLAWFVIMLVFLIINRSDLASCEDGLYLKVYYTGMLLILGIQMFYNIILLRNSMKGNIMDEQKIRRLVPCMVAGKIALFVPEIIWICLGTALLFKDLSDCPSVITLILKITLAFCWFLLFLLIVCIFFIFDPIGDPSSNQVFNRASRVWKLRCRVLCCWANHNEEENNSFEEISRIMAGYFYGTNLTITDIAAGFLLMNEGQRLKRHQNREMLTPYDLSTPERPPATVDTPEQWMNLMNAKHYMKFALASYGWLFFVYDRKFLGPFQLCCSSRARCCGAENIHGDKCCCNTNAILKQTNIDRKDIVYATFENKLYEIPFYIALDHGFKSIVVAVRGTLSFYDAITDLTIESQTLSIDSLDDVKAHKGILQAATYIRDTILNKSLLTEAFTQYPDYRLVITGHSLGAGAAAILSILLKPVYKDLICFSYSPPGWLVSPSLSDYMENFVCSVVVGKDLVPRMGVYTMNRLKSNLMNTIKNSDLPKYKILFRGFVKVCGFRGRRQQSDENSLLNENSSTEVPICVQESQVAVLNNPDPLFLPGKILYLESDSVIRKCCSTQRVYKAYWARKEYFDDILVSPKMVSEHKPDVVYTALKSIVPECCV